MRRWFGVGFGLLLGLAAVCHGCHAGDHDDELSVHGAPRTERDNEKQEMRPGAETPGDAIPSPKPSSGG